MIQGNLFSKPKNLRRILLLLCCSVQSFRPFVHPFSLYINICHNTKISVDATLFVFCYAVWKMGTQKWKIFCYCYQRLIRYFTLFIHSSSSIFFMNGGSFFFMSALWEIGLFLFVYKLYLISLFMWIEVVLFQGFREFLEEFERNEIYYRLVKESWPVWIIFPNRKEVQALICMTGMLIKLSFWLSLHCLQ